MTVINLIFPTCVTSECEKRWSSIPAILSTSCNRIITDNHDVIPPNHSGPSRQMEPTCHLECKCKIYALACVFTENSIQVACVSETWLKEDIPDEVVNVEGYITHRNDWSHKPGGGIAA